MKKLRVILSMFLIVLSLCTLSSCTKVRDVKLNVFNDGLLCVEKDGLYGYIDKKGKTVIDFKYPYAKAFHDGVAIVWELDPDTLNLEFFLINKKGEHINKKGLQYLELDYIDSRYIFKYNDKYGIMDKKGKIIINALYDEIEYIGNKKYKASLNDYYGILTLDGKIFVQFKYDELYTYNDGMLRFKKDDEIGYLDEKGNEVLSFENKVINDFINGKALIEDSYGISSIIDKKGNELFKCNDNQDIVNRGNNTFILEDTATAYPTYTFINEKGDKVVDKVFDYATIINQNEDGFSSKGKDYLIGTYTKEGKSIFNIFKENGSFIYSSFDIAGEYEYSTYLFELKTGNIFIEFKNTDETKNTLYHYVIINKKNKINELTLKGYRLVDDFAYKGSIVLKDLLTEKYGLADVKGNYIINCLYDVITPILDDNYIIFSVNGKIGVMNKKGKIIIEPIYDRYEMF